MKYRYTSDSKIQVGWKQKGGEKYAKSSHIKVGVATLTSQNRH